MLVLDNVSKSYGGKLVVHPISWTVAAGKTCVLIGPSGCGKSTLLRLMMGLVSPDAGSVQLDGEPMRGPRLLELRRRWVDRSWI